MNSLKPHDPVAHKVYIEALRALTPAQRYQMSCDLSEFVRAQFKNGLRKAFPELSEVELHALYLKRLDLCHNRNW